MTPLPVLDQHRTEALPLPTKLEGADLDRALAEGKVLRIHSIFATNQGEGAWIGKASAFIRLQGCSVGCTWCDTEYDTGHCFNVEDVVAHARSLARPGAIAVVTGGEPTDQPLERLVAELHLQGFRAHIETSGVRPVTAPFDWITVSPKRSFERTAQRSGHELKLVAAYPADDVDRLQAHAAPFLELPFEHFWLSPLEHPTGVFNTAICQEITQREPRWRLAIQAHKHWNIP